MCFRNNEKTSLTSEPGTMPSALLDVHNNYVLVDQSIL